MWVGCVMEGVGRKRGPCGVSKCDSTSWCPAGSVLHHGVD